MPDCRMYVRTSGDKARDAEKTRDDKGEKGRCFARPLRRTLARCGTRSGGCSTFLRHRRRSWTPLVLSPSRNDRVSPISLDLFSHLAASTCLPRRLPRPARLSLAFSLSFFVALLCPLPLRPLPCNPHPGYLSWPIVHLSLSLSHSFFLSLCAVLLSYRLTFERTATDTNV